MSLINKTSEYVVYLTDQINEFEQLSYFKKLENLSVDTFMLQMHNYTNLLKEHILHLAIAITKVPSDKCIKSLIMSLYKNTLLEGQSIVDNFKEYLEQFKDDPSYSTEKYYKKYALTLPFDKICNEICNILLTQTWQTVISTLATIEFLFIAINKQLNNYAQKNNKEHNKILTISDESPLLLLLSLDNEDENIVCGAIDKTVMLFMVLFMDINNIFDEELSSM